MKNKTALVTGASGGIGEVFARELAKSGYRITCVARSKEKLENLTRELGPGHRTLSRTWEIPYSSSVLLKT